MLALTEGALRPDLVQRPASIGLALAFAAAVAFRRRNPLAISLDRKTFAMWGTTRLMVCDQTSGKLVGSISLPLSDAYKGFCREFDRNEWVLQTDSATSTLMRIAIEP